MKQLLERILGVVEAGVAVTALASVLGFLGEMHWSLDLLSHFRVQYVVTLVLGAVVLLLARRWKGGAAAAVVALLSAIPLSPYYLGEPPVCPPASDTLRVLALNVSTRDGDPAAVVRLLGEERPDVAVLMEVDRGWVERVWAATEAAYPHRVAVPRDDNFGIALLSRHRLEDLRVVGLGEGVPSVEARLALAPGGESVRVLGTHPVPPAGGAGSASRDRQLRAVARRVRADSVPTLVVGDLNATPWSHPFRDLLRLARLRDTAPGRGIQPTWRPGPGPLAIPIDHALVSPGLCATERRLGRDVGSDHRPLIVSVVLTGETRWGDAPEGDGAELATIARRSFPSGQGSGERSLDEVLEPDIR